MLAQLDAGNLRDDIFRKLTRLSRTNIESIWEANFERIFEVTSRFLQTQSKTDSLQKEKCLELFKEMLVNQKDHFSGRCNEAFQLLLQVEKDSNPAVCLQKQKTSHLFLLLFIIILVSLFSVHQRKKQNKTK